MPRASVVLPVPRSPESVTTMPGTSAVASAAPARSVASGSSSSRSIDMSTTDLDALAIRIVDWGRELGFGAIGIADTDLAAEEVHLLNWLGAGRHGEMDYMAR